MEELEGVFGVVCARGETCCVGVSVSEPRATMHCGAKVGVVLGVQHTVYILR